MHVDEGEIVTLIGANGAGKSTLMMTIFGNPQAREGHDHLQRARHHEPADPRNRAAGDRAVARGAAHLPAHDRVRKSADGRLAGDLSISMRILSRSLRCFRA
jgi:ABC-type branched-subunit amino acid transport system ATPase component